MPELPDVTVYVEVRAAVLAQRPALRDTRLTPPSS